MGTGFQISGMLKLKCRLKFELEVRHWVRRGQNSGSSFCIAVKLFIRILRYWLVWTRAKVLIIYQTQVRSSADLHRRRRLLVIQAVAQARRLVTMEQLLPLVMTNGIMQFLI